MTRDWDDLPHAATQGRLEARPGPRGNGGRTSRNTGGQQAEGRDAPAGTEAMRPVFGGNERAGEQPLGLDGVRDGVIYVPSGYRADRPAPLALCLHGASGTGARSILALRAPAERHGILLLAPDSRGRTWDVLMGGYGPDVAFVDRALALMFARFAVDPAHLAIEGFSDGASYALSLGVANGDLFTHILAFSPGFMAPPMQVGAPRLYISHGTADRVLPIAVCSRRLAPQLARAGYDVRYHEFDGAHTVPREIADEATAWWLGRS